MNRLIFAIFVLVAAVSCQLDETASVQLFDNDIYATMEQVNATRTSMDSNNNVLWTKGDQIVAFMGTTLGGIYEIKEQYAGTTTGGFSKVSVSGNSSDPVSGQEIEHNVAVYPYSDEVWCMKNDSYSPVRSYKLNVVMPDVQLYSVDSFAEEAFPMVAVSSDNQFTFRNVCGGLKLQFVGADKICSIKLEGLEGEYISGKSTVVGYVDGSAPTVSMSSDAGTSITLDCGDGVQLDPEVPTTFIIAVPPVEFRSGMRITVVDADGLSKTLTNTSANTVKRSSLLNFPVIKYEQDCVFEIPDGAQTSYTMPAKGGGIQVPLITNQDYEVDIPEDADDWISVVQTKALRNETLTLSIAENLTTEDRSAEVLLKAADGKVLQSITVSQEGRKSLSILFVGNSLTQDGIAYLPYMLKNYYPEIDFKIYMWYIGGYDLSQQYQMFIGEGSSTDTIFSVAENTSSWTNYSKSKTPSMSKVLSTYSFDIVCMQEFFNLKTEYDEVTDWNNCRDYIVSNYTGGNDLEFITLFHAPKRGENVDRIYSLTEAGNALILQNTEATDMIPNGIAVYKALQTDLNSLGDKGGLSPDGTHTQEGLPCLLQTYVTMCWVFDRLGIDKSVYGNQMRMTTDIYKKISVPGANLGKGVVTGTDAQYILAQEIAIEAYEEGKKFVAANCKTAE